jgi:hypothetical protein
VKRGARRRARLIVALLACGLLAPGAALAAARSTNFSGRTTDRGSVSFTLAPAGRISKFAFKAPDCLKPDLGPVGGIRKDYPSRPIKPFAIRRSAFSFSATVTLGGVPSASEAATYRITGRIEKIKRRGRKSAHQRATGTIAISESETLTLPGLFSETTACVVPTFHFTANSR